MNYQEKFDLTENNSSYFSQQFDILVMGFREEEDERHSYIRKSLHDYKGIVYSFDTCENADKFHYKIETYKGKIIEQTENKSLIPDLQNLLKKKEFQGANVCIDITTLKQGILFLLIKLLIREIKPARLFAAYTEPKEYKKRSISIVGETEEFDLYDRIMGSSIGVPGFIKHQSSNDILLIAPMGFDCQRLQTIYENLKPKKIIPIVGFPSFVPGWNITAIKTNYMVLKSAGCFDMVKPCEAASPFELYELLTEEFHRYNNSYDIYISPLGTRPHCLGAAIFVSKNPSSYLIYDFPIEKKYRSDNILKADIYNLSRFIG
jgi:hypothetical protein